MRSAFFFGLALVVLACGDDTTGTGSGGGSSSSAASTSGPTTGSVSSVSASSGGDGGDGTASSGNTGGAGQGGDGGGSAAALTAACERFFEVNATVSEEIGCPAEGGDDVCTDVDVFGSCIAEWTAIFDCLADNTNPRVCSCESFGEGAGGGFGTGGSGGFGVGGGGSFDEFTCDNSDLCDDELQALGACNGGEGGGKTAGSGGGF